MKRNWFETSKGKKKKKKKNYMEMKKQMFGKEIFAGPFLTIRHRQVFEQKV